jgi:hypothetical protein
MRMKKKLTPEEQHLKDFIEEHFDFHTLKMMGFFAKEIKAKDYDKIAARVCQFFSYDSVYEYAGGDMVKTSSTTFAGKFADTVDKEGNYKVGGGFHIDVGETEFNCPLCERESDATEYASFNRSNNPVVNVTCKGCKRKLQIFSCPMTGKLSVDERPQPTT